MIKGIVFDWQGTLSDLFAAWFKEGMLKAQGVDKVTMRHSVSEIGMVQALAKHGINPVHVITHVQEGLIEEATHTLLATLQARQIQLGVASNCSGDRLRAWIQDAGWCQYFSLICGADVFGPKPAPSMLAHALDVWGIMPHECMMVGDSVVDIQMAKQAGVVAVGVTSGLATVSELATAQPDAIVHQVSDLLSMLEA